MPTVTNSKSSTRRGDRNHDHCSLLIGICIGFVVPYICIESLSLRRVCKYVCLLHRVCELTSFCIACVYFFASSLYAHLMFCIVFVSNTFSIDFSKCFASYLYLHVVICIVFVSKHVLHRVCTMFCIEFAQAICKHGVGRKFCIAIATAA